ncbi:hypothetical protein LAZ67_17000935 [Cordylochernes scorpioides]|uniref:CCHC-type domain-containing protein n=1 Tax=Cordylochernes scorpioides TaxID=51811 RepID=A0ABY6LEC1_9ARAC|nr:hypothetical protein LAZ67_17000935 [Cordylochernes scorpioides]
MEDVSRRRRKAIRGVFTKVVNDINAELKDSSVDKNRIYAKFDRLESLHLELVALNEQCQAILLAQEAITDDEVNREFEDCERYIQERFDVKQRICIIRSQDKDEAVSAGSRKANSHVKLPELELKTYDGSLENWLPWWAQFAKRHPSSGYGQDRIKMEDPLDRKREIPERLKALMDFLKAEVKSAQRLKVIEKGFKLEEPQGKSHYIRKERKWNGPIPATVSGLFSSHRTVECCFCERTSHNSWQCRNIDRLSPEDRDRRSRNARLCFRCLNNGHFKQQCRAQLRCKKCGKGHLDIFCRESSSKETGDPIKEKSTEPAATFSSQACTGQIMMMTTVALLRGSKATSLEVPGLKRDYVQVEALDQPKICENVPPLPKGDWLTKLRDKGVSIAPENFKSGDIDILIGADHLGKLLTGRVQQEDKVQIALNGLVAGGNLRDLWELDVLGIQDPIEAVSKKKRETELEEHFIKNIRRDGDQRYSVALPWKCERNNIPSNLEIAQRRLEACTSKLRKEKKVVEYSTILQEWEREGLIERIEETRPQRKGHYLPHRPVFKAESRTTPLRPVFDASCKSYNGLSLNDYLEKGPNFLEKIPEILIRFRERGIGVLADIRKAFQMISVQLQDQDFLRFLWWDQTDPMKVTVLRHKRVVFGLNCSPFILGAVIDHHLNSVQGPAAEIAKIMARSFYVDNLVTSLSSQEEVQQFQNTAVNIMEMAKMDLREWEFNLPVSNSKEEKGTTTKVLGLVWDKVEDVLNCDVSIEKDLPRRLTKRIVLSKIQQVFDPLGVYSPIFLPPKLLLQRSWELKIGWYSQLPEDMDREFRTWYSQIGLLSEIKITRHIWFDQTNKNEIHVFCDASKSAYAAVAYMRSEVQGRVHLSLLWSKSRLAPTRRVTIPRLELLACVLGARLVGSISTALTNSCPVTLWTESSTVIAWLGRKNESNVFVRNRVKEIRDTVNNENWKFVYGKLNPADLPSRGCSIVQFVSTNWWEGPEWLKGEKESWPSFEPTIDEEEILKEKRKTLQAHTTLVVKANRWFLDRRSRYSLNIKIMAWVLRFLDNARRIPAERGSLKVIELERAERKLLRLIQHETFPGKQAPRNGLKTIKSVEGLWCVETKLLHGQDPEVSKRPILLPRDHPLVEQMVREIHQQNGHGGAQFILSRLREKFLIIGGRRLIKQIIGKCVICRRHNQRPIQTPGAALPTNRIGLGKPFEVTGVDLLGPLHHKGGSKTNESNEFPELEKIRVNSFTRKYKILSKLNEELKQRFRKEYLGVLMQRAENKRELCIKEGDLVLIGQDNTKRILWPVGRIIKLYLGKDGVNRVAKVKTSTGEWLRPVQRLFPLEISSEETPEKTSGDKEKEKPLTIKTRSGREVRKPIRFCT